MQFFFDNSCRLLGFGGTSPPQSPRGAATALVNIWLSACNSNFLDTPCLVFLLTEVFDLVVIMVWKKSVRNSFIHNKFCYICDNFGPLLSSVVSLSPKRNQFGVNGQFFIPNCHFCGNLPLFCVTDFLR